MRDTVLVPAMAESVSRQKRTDPTSPPNPRPATNVKLLTQRGGCDVQEDDGKPAGGVVRRFALRYWLAIILVVLAAVFIAQNRDRQRVHVLWITVESPMWLLLTAMAVVGLVVGLLLHRRRRN